MPLYDPAGKPLGPASIIGSKKLADYQPLTDAELQNVVVHLEQGLTHGIPDETPVTMLTGILCRLVRRAQVGTENPAPPPPLPEMPWMTSMPERPELKLTTEQIQAALDAAHASEEE